MSTYNYELPVVSRLLSLPPIGQVLLAWGTEAGYHTDKDFYTACCIHKCTFSKIINGRLTLGDPSKPKILVKFVVALRVGRNGRRSIKHEGDLLRFLTELSKLPGQPVNWQGKKYVFDEVSIALTRMGISLGVEDSEMRFRAKAKQAAPHIIRAIEFYDDMEGLNNRVTISDERMLEILHEELKKLRGPDPEI